MFPELETPRLFLRSFRKTDVPAFAAYRSDPQVARYQSWDVPYTQAQATAFLAELYDARPATPGAWYQIAIECKETADLLGDCAFCLLAEDSRQADIGFTLRRSAQHQGFATEAVTRLLAYLFEDLALHRVRATCDADNHSSARLLARVGMRREGHTIASTWFKGRWSSEYWYALLREEWIRQTVRGAVDPAGVLATQCSPD